jgi:hypothetical protein
MNEIPGELWLVRDRIAVEPDDNRLLLITVYGLVIASPAADWKFPEQDGRKKGISRSSRKTGSTCGNDFLTKGAFTEGSEADPVFRNPPYASTGWWHWLRTPRTSHGHCYRNLCSRRCLRNLLYNPLLQHAYHSSSAPGAEHNPLMARKSASHHQYLSS